MYTETTGEVTSSIGARAAGLHLIPKPKVFGERRVQSLALKDGPRLTLPDRSPSFRSILTSGRGVLLRILKFFKPK